MDTINRVLQHPHVQRAAVAVTALSVAAVVAKSMMARNQATAEQKRLAAQKPGMVYLYQFPRLGNALNLSPYCVIVETFLRDNNIPYEPINGKVGLDASPNGRFPFINVNGEAIADSDTIVKRLSLIFNKPYAPTALLDRAASLMVVRLCSRALSLHYVRHLWVDHPQAIAPLLMSLLPPLGPLKRMIFNVIRQKSVRMLNLSGHGDLSQAEYHAQFSEDVGALSDVLAAVEAAQVTLSSYAKCVLFAFLHKIYMLPLCPAVERARTDPFIARFLRTTERTLFPDLAMLVPSRVTAYNHYSEQYVHRY
jgi:hypothetical protein